MRTHDSGGFASVTCSVPLNLAFKGPMAVVILTLKRSGLVCSTDSQPGRHFLRTSGLFKASQTCSWVAGMVCEPNISM